MTLDQFFITKGIRFKVKPHGFQLCCFHCGDTRYRLGITTTKNAYHCFNCGTRGSLRSLLHQLGATPGVVLLASNLAPAAAPVMDLPKGFAPLAGVSPSSLGLGRIRAYGDARGITPAQYEEWYVGGVIADTRVNHRLVFPVFGGGTLYSWCARATDPDSEPKYLMAPGGQRALWGRVKRYTVVAEGIFKALALQRYCSSPTLGMTASLGNMVTEFQMEQLVDGGCTEMVYYPDPLSIPSVTGMKLTWQLARDYGVTLYAPDPFPLLQADEDTAPRVFDVLDSVALVTQEKLDDWMEQCSNL